MQKILITGASGFLGSEFISKFSNDFEIISFSRKNITKKKNFFIYENGSIEDKKFRKILKKHSPDIVLHFANFGSMNDCEENSELAFKVNVLGTLNVILGCIETKSKLIFTSSREVYGETKNKNSSEDDFVQPNNFLGLTKSFAENLITFANKKYQLDYTILRISNIYGINGEKFVVKKMLNTAIQEKIIFVQGGKQELNLVHVNDVLNILKLVIKNPKLSSKQIFNVGSKDNITVLKLAEIIIELLNSDVKIKIKKARKSETQFYKPNIKKIEEKFDYKNWINLDEGIKEIIKDLK